MQLKPLRDVLLFVMAIQFLAFSVSAQEALVQVEQEKVTPDEEDTILGDWYIQIAEGKITPADETVRLHFDKDGTAQIFEGARSEESWTYEHDERAAKLTLLDKRGRVEVVLRYAFVDDMLVLRYSEGDNEREEVMELTRQIEGSEKHRKLRGHKPGDTDRGAAKPGTEAKAKALQAKSMNQLKTLFLGMVAYAMDYAGKLPVSVGHVVAGGYLVVDSVVPSGSDVKVPEGFKDWENQKKVDWVNKQCAVLYLASGAVLDKVTKQVVFVALPASGDAEQVLLAFGDGHVETLAYADADKRIKKQTGASLAEWRKTRCPGSGTLEKQDQKSKPIEQEKAPAPVAE